MLGENKWLCGIFTGKPLYLYLFIFPIADIVSSSNEPPSADPVMS